MIENLLSQRKASILEKWFDLILESYPANSRSFFKQEKDQFANPVGFTISHEIETIYEELLRETDCNKLAASLESIIKIRAVQDFTPYQAVAFVFDLKKAIRDDIEGDLMEKPVFEELLKFEDKIDQTALIAFEIYMRCREMIHEIRVNEIKNRTSSIFEKRRVCEKS